MAKIEFGKDKYGYENCKDRKWERKRMAKIENRKDKDGKDIEWQRKRMGK